MSRFYSFVILILVLLSFFIGLMFSINNTTLITLDFIVFNLSLPISLWVLGSLLFGVFLGIIASYALLFGSKFRRNKDLVSG